MTSSALFFLRHCARRARIRSSQMLWLAHTKRFSNSSEKHDVKNFIESKNPEVMKILSEDMTVLPNFLSEDEELNFLEEIEKSVKRLRYEFSHWDNAIHGYRETERRSWNEGNSQIIDKVRGQVFAQQDSLLAHIHILDLAKDGYIKPHIDAVRFCGDIIAGMSLMSSCVMRLALENDKEAYGNIYLPQRSLYIMKNRARYEFTHEVLKDEESFFAGNHIPKNRRISVICRNEPRYEDTL